MWQKREFGLAIIGVVIGDFKVVSKSYIPMWRRKAARRRVWSEVAMAAVSLAGLVFVWTPWREVRGLHTAISVQLSRGDAAAVALFVFMGLVLAAMAERLLRAGRKASALLMALEAVALGYLAFSDPYSFDHLATFVMVAIASSCWLVVLAYDLEDWWLGAASVGSIVALSMIPTVSMGLGERALVTSCLAGMNVMFFRHFG